MTRSSLHHRIGLRANQRRSGPVRQLLQLAILLLAVAPACKKTSHESSTDAGRSLPGIARERIEATNNADNKPLYTGSTGTVEGTITLTGPEAPDQPSVLEAIPNDCAGARQVYGKLFREGPGRTVADVLVAVTEYEGFVRPKSDQVKLLARDCSWDRRTIALTFGQRIDVRSTDNLAYIPQLLGGPTGALLVAVPNGEAIPVLPREPGHYVLVDAMRLYSKADVFVVRYPTTAVTGLDGRYRIAGVPVGPAKLSALLPSTGSTASRSIRVEANRSVQVDLVLAFDKTSNKTPAK